ncbi:unnamed protein product [Caenorhabditis brenneri]
MITFVPTMTFSTSLKTRRNFAKVLLIEFQGPQYISSNCSSQKCLQHIYNQNPRMIPPLCQVCGAAGAEPHFGGISCRACAAFFRRCVHTKKIEITCTCKQRLASSHPCRHCRMLKCMATGMIKCKVQATREKNKIKITCLPGSISSLSLLSCNIIPRECANISNTVANWGEVDTKRKGLYGDSVFEMNFTQFSNVTKPDTLLLWDLAVKIFPDAKLLSGADKQAILCNFFPRWMMLDSAIGFCTSYEESSKYIASNDYTNMLLHFYGTSMPPEKRLKDDQIIETFKPYWDFHYYETAVPIYFKKLDKIEYMAIFLLLLFDDAYANISEEGAVLCRNLRKVVKRELKGYQTDNNCYEKRFIDTMDVLLLLEKAEEKITSEVLICAVNNVTLSDDFKAIFHVKKI